MNIVHFIQSEPMYKKYQDRYNNAMVFYSSKIPTKTYNAFLAQATVCEIADEIFTRCPDDFGPARVVNCLVSLERNGLFTVPHIPGILCVDFWDEYYKKNCLRICDLAKELCRS